MSGIQSAPNPPFAAGRDGGQKMLGITIEVSVGIGLAKKNRCCAHSQQGNTTTQRQLIPFATLTPVRTPV